MVQKRKLPVGKARRKRTSRSSRSTQRRKAWRCSSSVGRHAGLGQPWKGLGSGVYELVDHRGDTFRAVYTVRVGDAVHVLHAFQKKSKSGIATPQPDVELIEKRLKAVLARYGASGRT